MGRRVDVDDLAGAADLAVALGYQHIQSLHSLRHRRADFPSPIFSTEGVHVWSRSEVVDWFNTEGPGSKRR